MSTDSEGYETCSSHRGGSEADANDRRIAQIEKAFGSGGQVRKRFDLAGNWRFSHEILSVAFCEGQKAQYGTIMGLVAILAPTLAHI